MANPNAAADRARQFLPIIDRQEQLLRFSSFTADDAFTIGSAIRAAFYDKVGRGLTGPNGIAISIELFNGDILFKASVGDKTAVTADNWHWIAAKSRTVARFNRSTYYMGQKAIARGKDFGTYGPAPIGSQPDGEYAFHGGGFPIWVKNVPVGPIGAIIVSGLPQEMDHQLIVDVLSDHLGAADVPSVVGAQA